MAAGMVWLLARLKCTLISVLTNINIKNMNTNIVNLTRTVGKSRAWRSESVSVVDIPREKTSSRWLWTCVGALGR